MLSFEQIRRCQNPHTNETMKRHNSKMKWSERLFFILRQPIVSRTMHTDSECILNHECIPPNISFIIRGAFQCQTPFLPKSYPFIFVKLLLNLKKCIICRVKSICILSCNNVSRPGSLFYGKNK